MALLKYGEPTVTLSRRVPESKVQEISEIIDNMLMIYQYKYQILNNPNLRVKAAVHTRKSARQLIKKLK